MIGAKVDEVVVSNGVQRLRHEWFVAKGVGILSSSWIYDDQILQLLIHWARLLRRVFTTRKVMLCLTQRHFLMFHKSYPHRSNIVL